MPPHSNRINPVYKKLYDAQDKIKQLEIDKGALELMVEEYKTRYELTLEDHKGLKENLKDFNIHLCEECDKIVNLVNENIIHDTPLGKLCMECVEQFQVGLCACCDEMVLGVDPETNICEDCDCAEYQEENPTPNNTDSSEEESEEESNMEEEVL